MSAQPRILIVEDDSHVARAMERMLANFELRVVSTIEAARASLDFEPDVGVLDFYLPDGTARDLAGLLACPVLLTSSDLDAKNWEEWGAYIADDFLHKPFTGTALRHKVERLYEQRRLQLEVTRASDELRRVHSELVAHIDAQDAEAVVARDLLDRMVQRSKLDREHVSVELLMARRFGGDVVFADELPDGRYRWLVGDVTGHTLASALVTIPISMIFHTTCRRTVPLVEVVATLQEQLGEILPPSMFFAATLCELDRRTGVLSVYNAGAPDVIVRKAGELVRIPSDNFPLAAARDHKAPAEARELQLAPGDAVYVFSDGLIEISDGATMFGLERVVSTLAGAPAEEAFDRLGRAWREHLGTNTRDDDLALIEVRV